MEPDQCDHLVSRNGLNPQGSYRMHLRQQEQIAWM